MPPREEDEKLDLGIPVEDPNVKVDLSESADDDDELLEGGKATKGDGEQPEKTRDPVTGKWGKAKAERGKNRREETNWRTEKTQLEAQMKRQQDDSDRRFREMQQRLDQSMQRPQQTGQPADPFASKFADIDRRLTAELKLLSNDPNNDDYTAYNAIRREETRLIAQQEAYQAKQFEAQRPQPQASPYAARVPIIESEFPWLQDPRFKDLGLKAQVIKQGLVSLDGRPDTLDTDREALATAVARFGGEYGLRTPAAPSPRTRQMYEAPVSQNGPYRGTQPTEIELPRQLVNGSGLNEAALRAALRRPD
jgi:hypothetical protein